MDRKKMIAELRSRVLKKFEQPAVQKAVPVIVAEFIQIVIDELKSSGKTQIPGLGVLKAVDKPAGKQTTKGSAVTSDKIYKLIPGKKLREGQ